MVRRWWTPTLTNVNAVVQELRAGLARAGTGSPLAGRIRDQTLLEAALALPRQPYYRTTVDKAAALFRSLVKNHPFADGNKRVGLTTTAVFLERNGYGFIAANRQATDFTLLLAISDPATPVAEIAAWLRRNTKRSKSR